MPQNDGYEGRDAAVRSRAAGIGFLRDRHDAAIGNLSAYERSAFWARVALWVPQLEGPIEHMYGEGTSNELLSQLIGLAAKAAAARKPDLRALDAARAGDPSWFQSPELTGYVAYVEQFGPTLPDIARRADHLEALGVRYFHLMKVLKNRPAPNDGGFAIVDYGDVDLALGTVADLERLADELRRRHISLCLDVVMNHTAREHEWAERARAGEDRYRQYYLTFPDRTEPDDYERSLPEVFPDMAPGNFTWDDEIGGWVWTTFNSYQWDLNYRNPQVLAEMLDAMLTLANIGVDVLRLDAVAFTWKRKGTNCQNQPEAHLIVQLLRGLIAIAAPAVVLKAEAIVGPRDLTAYLGAHEQVRAECQIAYHNQLMVMVWSSLATRDARLITTAMAKLPPTPIGAGWVTYVRCHDDIGWAVDDADAADAAISGPAHRRFLADWYRGDFPGSFAQGAAFGVNEATGDERTCGTTASLCGIGHAEASGDPNALDLGIARMLVAYTVVAAFGIPLLYMGDEIALPNDLSYRADPTRAPDPRWMHRPAMDWARADRRHVPGTTEQRVYDSLARLLRTRRETLSLAQGGSTTVLRVDDDRVFAFARSHPEHGRLLGLANFSEALVSVAAAALDWAGVGRDAVDVLGSPAVTIDDDRIRLGPLSCAWFTADASWRVVPLPTGATP